MVDPISRWIISLSAIRGEPAGGEIIDVYQAVNMTLPGVLGYRSIMEGNRAMDVPYLRNKQAGQTPGRPLVPGP